MCYRLSTGILSKCEVFLYQNNPETWINLKSAQNISKIFQAKRVKK
jgi:hypothetical protein